MSPDSFSDLLAREADRAPHVLVPADTWRRGRRRRAAKVAGALLGVVAVVVGVAVAPSLVDRERTPGPAGTSPAPGLPNHLEAPPERMSDQDDDGSWIREEVSSDLAVGRAAAAWVTPGGLPVVVDAETGEHHLLDLPGVVSADLQARTFAGPGWQPVALSPDGTRLAYGFASVDGRDPLGGINVIDLTTGGLDSSDSVGSRGAPVVVESLSWSRGGTWLAFSGDRLEEWTESSIGGSQSVVGFLDSEGGSRIYGVRGVVASAAVTDEGVGYAVGSGVLRRTCPPENLPDGAFCSLSRSSLHARDLQLVPGANLSPDGNIMALSTGSGYDLVTLPGVASSGGVAPPVRPVIGGEGAPDDRPWSTTSLGWVDDGHVLVLRDPGDGSPSRLAVVPADAEDGPSVDVGTVDPGVRAPSIAMDLVTLDRPTVDRPDPDWPWSEERWVATVGAGVLVALLLLLGVARLLRRRHPGQARAGG